MIKIAPSILASDFARLGEVVREAERGGADYIHVDVMDGRFVPNITVGPVIVKAIRPHTRLPLDVHLMIEDPDRFIPAFAEAGANILTVQQEACTHLHRVVELVRECGARPSVALNPGTPVGLLEEMLPFVDQVLIMTVNPGFGGQAFIETMPRKIAALREMIRAKNLQVEIEVDGGIETVTAPRVVRAGANVLVAGTAIFKSSRGVAEAIRELRDSAVRSIAV